MESFMMQPVKNTDENSFAFFNRKDRMAEAILEGVRCRIGWVADGKVSMITEDNRDITDRFIGILYDDAERLANTELEGVLMIKREKESIDTKVVEEITNFSKESIEQIIKDAGLSVVFVATDLLVFLGESFYDIGYAQRKLRIEDVLIGIDNTFALKYKDNYTLSHPMENSKENFFSFCLKGNKGMIFRDVTSKYIAGESTDWQELLLVSKPQ